MTWERYRGHSRFLASAVFVGLALAVIVMTALVATS